MQLPQGFHVSGVACGIKDNPETLDLALFVSEKPCAASGVFTQNRVVGAPVKISRERVPSENIRAVVINSGNANACTGEDGLRDAKRMTADVGDNVGCLPEQVLVCSTGIIGRPLPLAEVCFGIPKALSKLGTTDQHLENAAKAMMTTDTVHKVVSRVVETKRGTVTVTGVAKGAAMIAPNMATMLSVIMTDAVMSKEAADGMLRNAVNSSFNCISVEGHTSTSDTVLLLANGVSGVENSEEINQLVANAVKEVATELAQMIVRDAEGAEHFVTVNVTGAKSNVDALAIAKTVADDALVKTAIAGNDPNWGRIVSTCGRCGIDLTEGDISLAINGTAIFNNGQPGNYEEEQVSTAMKTGEVVIDITLGFNGDGTAQVWTCDLTQEYVRLNSEYTT